MKQLFYAALLTLGSVPCFAQTSQTSSGPCSPNIAHNRGVVNNYCILNPGTARTKELKLIAVELPSNNEDGKQTKEIVDFFDLLQKFDGELVYLRLHTYVGAGFGLEDVPKNRAIKAGVVYELDLDGFGGNPRDYEYGYRVELNEYRKQWGSNRTSTILFPKSGNAFFDVHSMKSMSLDGLAKIRVSDIQGFQFIEIVPAQPVGGLLAQYEAVREKLPKKKLRSEF